MRVFGEGTETGGARKGGDGRRKPRSDSKSTKQGKRSNFFGL